MTPETKGIINAARIATMKKGVRMVNCARAGSSTKRIWPTRSNPATSLVRLWTCLWKSHRPIVDWSICRRFWQPLTLERPRMKLRKWSPSKPLELVVAYLKRNEIRCAVNMAPLSASRWRAEELPEFVVPTGPVCGSDDQGPGLKGAEIIYRGEAPTRRLVS